MLYPKPTQNAHYLDLLAQATASDVSILSEMPDKLEHDLIMDAIFGFSFKGDIREPYYTIIQKCKESKLPVVSVDIPSGWTVDTGENSQGFVQPECLISLSAPKLAAAQFKGVHYLGGRFMPHSLLEKYKCKCPIPYKDAD